MISDDKRTRILLKGVAESASVLRLVRVFRERSQISLGCRTESTGGQRVFGRRDNAVVATLFLRELRPKAHQSEQQIRFESHQVIEIKASSFRGTRDLFYLLHTIGQYIQPSKLQMT
jgi:hypothetical protein